MKHIFLIALNILIIQSTAFSQSGWFSQNQEPENTNLKSVHFSDNNTGWSVGNSGAILKTTNGGINWTSQSVESLKDLRSVYFTDNNTGWISGYDYNLNSGIILRTTNGGTVWTTQYSGTGFNIYLNSVYFVNNNTGWAVGSLGELLYTTNGGSIWSNQVSGITSNLKSVQFVNNNTGWIAGDGGKILNTTNGGSNWTSQISGTGNDDYFESVYFTDNNNGWAAGISILFYWPFVVTGNLAIKTTNGGTTWTRHQIGTSNGLTSVFFTDVNTGWILGQGIHKTINGGANWILQESGTSNELFSVYFTDNNTGWVVGDSGNILKTTTGGDDINLNKCAISGPDQILTGFNSELFTSSVQNGYWTLSNYDNTQAWIVSGNSGDSVLINAGTNAGQFILNYRDNVNNNLICSKNVSVVLHSLDLKYRLEAMFPIPDTIKVYLANSVSPFAIIDSSVALSQLDVNKFNAQLTFANAVSGNSYYIIVKHRNSIETWSTAPVTFVNGTNSYDFTTSANMAFGNNMKQVSASPDIFAIYSGDVNQDGTIDAGDLSQVENGAAVTLTGYVNSDVNGDNTVDAGDVAVVENNVNLSISVMAP